MTARRVTSHDVAREAGVSRSTVSLVLNDVLSARISGETRERVKRAARKLGYIPHAAGKALVTQRTMNIGLVFSAGQAAHPFLLEVIGGLATVTARHDLRLLVDMFQDDATYESLLRLTRAKHIDGLVMFEPRTGDPGVHQLVEDGFPLVFIGSLPTEKVCTVDVDNRSAARDVVRHLAAIGRRRIGCITNAPMVYTAAASRYDGYVDALRERGMEPDAALFRPGGYTAQSGYEAMADMLRRALPLPDAVFVASDIVAIGAMRAIGEHGLRIPADVAVAGFDDIPLAAQMVPPLTTVRFSGAEEGRLAGEALVKLIAGRLGVNHHERVSAELVVRGSSVERRPEFGMRYSVLLDCGDTLVDEATEVKDARGATQRAELIPGAAEMVRALAGRGYCIGLVADGPTDTFRNVLSQHGLTHLFATMAISEEVGVSKPDPLIFRAALTAMGVPEADYGRVVMVGNNLERDVKGANGLGLVSVWLRWSPRRSRVPADSSEVPAHTIDTPLELLGLLERLEAGSA